MKSKLFQGKQNLFCFNLNLGRWLKEKRIAAAVSLEQAAIQIEQAPQYLVDLESGHYEIPCHELAKLASYYKASPAEALGLMFDLLNPGPEKKTSG